MKIESAIYKETSGSKEEPKVESNLSTRAASDAPAAQEDDAQEMHLASDGYQQAYLANIER